MPVSSFSGGPIQGDSPQTLTLVNTSVGGTSWDWDFGDGSTHEYTETPAPHTYTVPGSYDVTLAINGGAVSHTESAYVYVYCTADFTATPLAGNANLSVQFTDASLGDIQERIWDFGDGVSVDSVSNPLHIYTTPGVYTVILIVQDLYSQDIKTRTEYVLVNERVVITDFVIAHSYRVSDDKYWKFYVSQDGYLIFETETYTWTSKEKIAVAKKWLFVEFHLSTEEMYVGSADDGRTEVEVIKNYTV